PGFPPGRVATDHVACAGEAELDQRGGGEDRRAAVIAEQQDLLVETTDVRVAPAAVGVEAPFEHGAWDMERARDDPVALAVDVSANVDQEGAPFACRMCFGRLETLDPRLRSFQQLFEGSP